MSGADVVAALKRVGFVFDRQAGSHMTLRNDELRRSVTVAVHGGRDVPTGTLRRILRDAGLTVDEFTELLC